MSGEVLAMLGDNGRFYVPALSKESRYYHRERAKIISALGGVCEVCGGTDRLEIHHIHPVGAHDRPGAYRIRDWKKCLKEGTLGLRCYEHHDRTAK
jgi:hypothetical protein